ncbi:MAG TPA: hypothetical protein VLN47_05000, partial [Clostridiaceae bacterium]|nr:hypothetical protein [Clostridiaceae bacterium]
ADMTPEVFPDPSYCSREPEPEAEPDVPASRIGMTIEIDGEAYGQADEDTGESIPSTSPSQVSHLQDEIWMDPTDPFIFEPDESADDADAPFADIVEEQEIFGIEEDADLSLMAEEDPLLEEVLVLPLEEDPLTTPETLPEAILDSDDWATSSNLEKRASEDPPAAADSLTSSSSTKADSAPPLEEMSVLEKPGDQPGPVFQTEIPDVPPLPQEEIPAEDTPEQAPPVPLLEEVTAPPKKDSLDLRQYLKEPKEEETKGLKSKFRKTFGKKPPS